MGSAIVSSSGAGAPGTPGGGSWSGPGGGGNGEPGETLSGGTAARAPGGGAPGGKSPKGGTPGGNGPEGGAPGGNGAPGTGALGGTAPGAAAIPGKAPGATCLGLAAPARGRQGCPGLAWPLTGPHVIGRAGSKFWANAAELAVKDNTVADFAMALVSGPTFISPQFLVRPYLEAGVLANKGPVLSRRSVKIENRADVLFLFQKRPFHFFLMSNSWPISSTVCFGALWRPTGAFDDAGRERGGCAAKYSVAALLA